MSKFDCNVCGQKPIYPTTHDFKKDGCPNCHALNVDQTKRFTTSNAVFDYLKTCRDGFHFHALCIGRTDGISEWVIEVRNREIGEF